MIFRIYNNAITSTSITCKKTIGKFRDIRRPFKPRSIKKNILLQGKFTSTYHCTYITLLSIEELSLDEFDEFRENIEEGSLLSYPFLSHSVFC